MSIAFEDSVTYRVSIRSPRYAGTTHALVEARTASEAQSLALQQATRAGIACPIAGEAKAVPQPPEELIECEPRRRLCPTLGCTHPGRPEYAGHCAWCWPKVKAHHICATPGCGATISRPAGTVRRDGSATTGLCFHCSNTRKVVDGKRVFAAQETAS